ncbi:AbrB family transcriptional regulator [Nocardioidaceae bacterium]|nr:AbrB family transcriptional regulator [Nocardioidaceae bacterium]
MAVDGGAESGPGLLGRWVLVTAAVAAATAACLLIGLPSPVLFGALVGTVALSLGAPRLTAPLSFPAALFRVGQAAIGVVIGAIVQVGTITRLAENWVAVTLVVVGTLGLSIATGRLLALLPHVDRATGICSMVAGGASGVVAIARDVGADDRTVAVVQYVRVLVVVLSLPVIAGLFFDAAGDGGTGVAGGDGTLGAGLAVSAVSIVGGLLFARLVPLPAAALLAPLAIAATLSATGAFGEPAVPALLEQGAYVVIGVAVGLRFTRSSIRHVARLLPWAMVAIVVVIAGSGLMGVALAAVTGVSQLTAYLATTPGGLFAVLPLAAGAGADVTFVLTLQVVRIVVMLAVTPLLANWLTRHADTDGPDRPPGPREDPPEELDDG